MRKPRFALIANPADINHLYQALAYYKSKPVTVSEKALQKLIEWTPSFKGTDIPEYFSKTGEMISGFHVFCTFIPEMVDLSYRLACEKIIQACRVAKEHGADIAVLGGFCSIGIANRQEAISKQIGIKLTTGNTFTTYLTIKGVLRATELCDVDLATSRVAIIGASGDIGSGCSRYFAKRVAHLTLTAVGIKKLNAFADTLRENARAEIETTTDNKRAVHNADIVITTAATTDYILDLSDFKPGAIVCDVGYPKNVSVEVSKRSDVFAFAGGLAELPDTINFGYTTQLPKRNILYGCLAEGLILTFEHKIENFSSGRGNISEDKLTMIGRWAEKHGFMLAPFCQGDKLILQSQIDTIRKRIIHARNQTHEDASS